MTSPVAVRNPADANSSARSTRATRAASFVEGRRSGGTSRRNGLGAGGRFLGGGGSGGSGLPAVGRSLGRAGAVRRSAIAPDLSADRPRRGRETVAPLEVI